VTALPISVFGTCHREGLARKTSRDNVDMRQPIGDGGEILDRFRVELRFREIGRVRLNGASRIEIQNRGVGWIGWITGLALEHSRYDGSKRPGPIAGQARLASTSS